MLAVDVLDAKTLIVYYSFTNNSHLIATELQSQTGGDLLRVEPAEEGLDYAADGYALGSALISAIRNNPGAASSYPAIKPVEVDMSPYNMVIAVAPLWWNNMAAPLQTFLFHYGGQMAGKKIGVVVSSASSGITQVVSDARRLIPGGDFVGTNLHIRSSQTSNRRTLIANWLNAIDYDELTGVGGAAASFPGVSVRFGVVCIAGEFDSVSLYNALGHKVLETQESRVTTSFLVPGLYVVRVKTGGSFFDRKVLVGRNL